MKEKTAIINGYRVYATLHKPTETTREVMVRVVRLDGDADGRVVAELPFPELDVPQPDDHVHELALQFGIFIVQHNSPSN